MAKRRRNRNADPLGLAIPAIPSFNMSDILAPPKWLWMAVVGAGGFALLWTLLRKRSSVMPTGIGSWMETTGIGSYNAAGVKVGNRKVTTLTESNVWFIAYPSIRNALGNRSAAAYNAVIDQFKVATNPRYTPRGGDTFCNIFVEDVMFAMGIELPWDHANEIADWLSNERDGWRQVTAQEAQDRANAGYPTVTAFYNYPGIGHLSVVRPGNYATFRAVMTANAGADNFNNGSALRAYTASMLSRVRYYTHD